MIYLYLGKRNKKSIKILAVLNNSNQITPTRVPDVKALNLSKNLENKIMKQSHQDRMEWELWIESAANFAELRDSLKKRDYKELPFCSSPQYISEEEKVVNSTNEIKKVDIKINPPLIKTMLRKIN